MAWNNGDMPLHNGVLPPFLYGKGIHNRWIINEAMSSDFRFVFDSSWTVLNFYQEDLDHGSYQSVGGSNVPDVEKGSWENDGNSHLGAIYGSLYFHEANYSNMVKLVHCGGHYSFLNTVEDIVFPLGSRRNKFFLNCVDAIKSQDRTKECSVKDQLKPSTSLSLPFSLEELLSVRADENKTIVLATAGFSYKDMLMSWVCRLRQLHISNFLVCALDRETYEFSVLQVISHLSIILVESYYLFYQIKCHVYTLNN